MCKNNDPTAVIQNWMRNRDTVEFSGLWESLHNLDFNPFEFEGLRMQAGLKINIKNSEMLEIIRQGVENREDREIIQERCRQKHEEIAEIQQSLNSAKTKQQMENSHTNQLREIYDTVSGISGNFAEYDDELVRMAVTKVKILSDTKAQITLFDSIKIDTELI